MTLVEVVVSLAIVVLVVFGMTSVMVHSSRASDRTTSQSDIDSGVAIATERVEGRLIEARSVTIDDNGLGLTYKYPAKNLDGTYSSNPKSLESTSRRLYVSDDNKLYCSDEPDRPILTDIPDIDPETQSAMRVFQVGINSREVQVRLVSQRTLAGGCQPYSAITIRVRPRNMR